MNNNRYSIEYIKENYNTEKLSKESITSEFLFYFMIENKCDSSKVRELSEIINKGVNIIRNEASKYKKYVPTDIKELYEELVEKEDNKIQKKMQKKIYSSNENVLYKTVIENIYNCQTIEEAIEYLKVENMPLSIFKRNLISYELRAEAIMKQEEAAKIIKRVIKLYKEYEKYNEKEAEQKREESKLKRKDRKIQAKDLNIKIASNYVSVYTTFLPMSKEEFCAKNHIKIEELEEFINTTRKNKLDVYEEYHKKINSLKLSDPKIAKQVKLIKTLLVNGVVNPENEVRKFELLDYYEITKMDLLEFLDLIVDDLSLDELRIIKSFVMTHSQIKEVSKEEIEKYKLTLMIDGKELEETTEDKEFVLNDLKEKNIPLNNLVYKQALKKYMKTKTTR